MSDDKRLVDRWKALENLGKVKAGEGQDGERLVAGEVTVGSVDSDGEVLEQQSAFKGLQQWVADGGTPITYNHELGGSLGHAIDVLPMKRSTSANGPRFVEATGQDDIEASRILASIARGYGFDTMLHGHVEVDAVWSMLIQKAINRWSIHIRGYEAAEPHEPSGAPLVITQRVIESALVTVPAQREAVAVVERMLKSFGVPVGCKQCEGRTREGFERLGRLHPEQWRYVVEHAREHGQDEGPEAVLTMAKALHGVGQMLRAS